MRNNCSKVKTTKAVNKFYKSSQLTEFGDKVLCGTAHTAGSVLVVAAAGFGRQSYKNSATFTFLSDLTFV